MPVEFHGELTPSRLLFFLPLVPRRGFGASGPFIILAGKVVV